MDLFSTPLFAGNLAFAVVLLATVLTLSLGARLLGR
jgi:hypothetical protein